MEFKFSPHAVEWMERRSIPLQVVMMVLDHPEQVIPAQEGRNAYQSEVDVNGKLYILRVIVEPDGTVVTVYRTSKISKYRSEE